MRRLPTRAAVERAVGTLWRTTGLWYREEGGKVVVDPGWLRTPERRRQLWERVARREAERERGVP
jgi:predicted kinase